MMVIANGNYDLHNNINNAIMMTISEIKIITKYDIKNNNINSKINNENKIKE